MRNVSSIAAVAEPKHQYGADVFEAYMKEKKAEPGRMEMPAKAEKEKSMGR